MYVCGDAQRMAHDVHKMLLYIAQMEGNMNVNNADNFLKSLEDESRYPILLEALSAGTITYLS
jgi:sulfite reductase (NADPH) flavoprotein alpha-component